MQLGKRMERRDGIEPPLMVLQTIALPLGGCRRPGRTVCATQFVVELCWFRMIGDTR